MRVRYRCSQTVKVKKIQEQPEDEDPEEDRGIPPCGHGGECSVLSGSGKLRWRLDWPLRWYTYGVHYELYGKDLKPSADLGQEAMAILGRPAPAGMCYGPFLDEKGEKISKRRGNGITLAQWLEYGDPGSLRLLLLSKPEEEKRIHLGIIPRYMDESLALDARYHQGTADPRARDTYGFVTFSQPRPTPRLPEGVSFSMLCGLAVALGKPDEGFLKEYALRTWPDLGHYESELEQLARRACRYARDVLLPQRHPAKLSEQQHRLVRLFLEYLEQPVAHEAEAILGQVRELAGRCSIQAREGFNAIYEVLLGQPEGPRLGSFIVMLGQRTAARIIRERLQPAPDV